MNRFAHANIDLSLTDARRQAVMTRKVGPSRPVYKRYAVGVSKAARKLEVRRYAFDLCLANMKPEQRSSVTKPGSLNLRKG